MQKISPESAIFQGKVAVPQFRKYSIAELQQPTIILKEMQYTTAVHHADKEV